MKNQKLPSLTKKYLLILLGISMMAVGIYFFKAPNGFATGGVSGVAILLAKLPFSASIGLTQSLYMAFINVLLLILGVLILGKGCGFLTCFCSVILSMLNILFEFLFPLNSTLTGYPLLELIYAVLLTGIGSAILFKNGASSGGTDIIALILKKHTKMNVGKALLLTDFLIACGSFLIYGITSGLFSILGLFAKVFVIDDIIDSINMCKAFTIITSKPKEIEDFIVKQMHHGATIHNAEGVFTGEEKKVIITVCRRTEALKLRTKVKEIDPHSFIIITKTSEIMGKGFRDVVE